MAKNALDFPGVISLITLHTLLIPIYKWWFWGPTDCVKFGPLDLQVSQQLQRSRSLFSSAAPPRIVVSGAPTALDAAAAAATTGDSVVVVSAASVSWLKWVAGVNRVRWKAALFPRGSLHLGNVWKMGKVHVIPLLFFDFHLYPGNFCRVLFSEETCKKVMEKDTISKVPRFYFTMVNTQWSLVLKNFGHPEWAKTRLPNV